MNRKLLLVTIVTAAVFAGAPAALAIHQYCELDPTIGCTTDADCSPTPGGLCVTGGDTIPAMDGVTSCMQDVAGFGLNCTANDIQVSAVSDVVITDPCDFPGDTAVLSMTATFLLTAQARHDLGAFISADGGDALNGECSISTVPYAPDPPFVDLDGLGQTCSLDGSKTCTKNGDCDGRCANDSDSPTGKSCSNSSSTVCTTDAECFFGTCTGDPAQDECGDINADHNPIVHRLIDIEVTCDDDDGDGNLEVNACLSWRQPGANDLCLTPLDAFPGAPSKCRCQELPGLTVPVPGQIIVDKVTVDADGNPLPGDPTSFEFSITGPDADLPESFSLADADPPHTSPGLTAPNDYSVDEINIPTSWELDSANCVSDQGNPDQDPTLGEVTVNNGETLTCTFTDKLVFVPDPAIDIVKTAVATDLVALTIDYEFEVTNIGNVDLSNVTVTDPLIEGSPNNGTITCPETTLDTDLDGEAPFEGESMICTATYNLTQADVDAGIVDNTATATGDCPDGTVDCASDTDDEQVDLDAFGRLVEIDLVKDGTLDLGPDGIATPGDLINYTFTVDNTGDTTLFNISVTDPMVSPIDCGGVTTLPQIASLLPTDTPVVCTGSYAITQTDIDAGVKNNTATAAGEGPQGEPASDTDDHSEPIPQAPGSAATKDHELTTDVDPAGVSLGDTITYTYTLTNTGNVTISNAVIADTSLAGLTALTCNLAQPAVLAPTEVLTCTATYVVAQDDVDAGNIHNEALVTGECPSDPEVGPTCVDDCLDNTDDAICNPDDDVDVPQNPGSAATKDHELTTDVDPAGVSLGDTITYTYTLTNTGNVTISNAVIADTSLAGLSALTCNQATPATLLPDQTLTCTATYVVTQDDVNAGNIHNEALVTGECPTDPEGGPTCVDECVDNTDTDEICNPDDDTPIEQSPSSAATKDHSVTDDVDPAGVSLGDTITYTYTLTNTGNVTISNAEIADTSLAGLSAVTCDQATPATLLPGQTLTCTATYLVTQADVNAGNIHNEALVTGGCPTDPDAGPTCVDDCLDNTDDAICNPDDDVDVPQTPGSAATKGHALTTDVDPAGVSLGDTITYTYTLTNTGNVTISNAEIADTSLAGLSALTCNLAQPAVLAPIEVLTCTATYVVTQDDVNAGNIHNEALVTGGCPTDPAGGPTCVDECVDNTDTDEICNPDDDTPIVQNPSITVEKSSATTSLSAPGTVTYDYLVTNTGNVTITGLVLSDNNDNDDMSCGSSTLTVAPDAGSTTTCTATHTFTQAELDAGGTLDNLVTASSNEAPDATDDLSIPIVQNPSITVEKSSATTSLSAPGTVTYDYLVTNTGNVTITGLVLSDNNDNDDMSCGSSTLTVAPDAGSTTTCTATHTFTQAELDAGGTLDNLVTASSNEAPDATDDLSIPIVQNPSITVEKSSATTSLSAPGTVTYDYLVTNTGNVTITGLVLSDNNDNDDMSCGSSTLTVAPDAGSTTTCTATHTFTQAELDAGGTLDNLVTASSNEAPDATDDLSIPIVQNPSITVEKSSATTSLSAPGTVTYDYLVTNTGNVTITGLVLSDNNDNDDMSCGSSTLTVAPDAGSTTTCTATHTFTQAELDAGGTLDNLVTASSNEAPDATDDLSIPIVQNPSITVEKSSATTSLSAPGTVTYDYLVTNTGNVTITGLVLSDNNDNDDMSCGSSTLTVAPDAGSTTTCTATHTFTQAELDAGGTLDNLVTASSNEAPDATDDLSIPIVQNPSITVEKSSATTSLSAPGTVTYDYLVTNTGNVTITGLVLSDNNDNDDMSCGSSTLTVAPDAGSTTTCTATHTFTQAELDAGGTLDNLVTASSNEAPDATDDLSIPIVQNPSITVEKSSATTSLSAPGTVTYDYLVTNTGNVTITGLVLSDNNDNDDMSCGSSTLTVAPDAGSTTTCTATHTFTQAELDAGGTLDNLVTASSNEAPDATDDLSIPIVQNPSITVEKSSATTSLSAPGTVTYDYLVTNTGNVTITGLVLSDNNDNDDMSCGSSTLTVAPDAGSTTTCTATHTFTQAELDAGGTLDNLVTASSNEAPDATDDLSIPIVQNPSITVEKSSATTSLSAPGTVTYDYLVTNTGNVTITGLVLSDNNDNDDMSCGSSTLTVAPDAGSTTTCTATHTFTQAELDAGGTLDNLVTASSNEAPDATDDLSIPIVQNPSITVEKSSATTSLSAPGTVTYDYLVTNTGNVTITGLVLSDNNDNDDMSCGSSTLTVAPDAGSTTTCTATHTFTQAELDAGGTLDNLVTASSNEAPDATDDLSIPIVQNPSITVEKSSATTSLSAPGTVTYDYLVTNTGNVTITGLVLSDNNDNDDMSCGSSTLTVAPDAGSTTTCTATHTFTQAELDAGGTLDNLVTASSNEAPDATDDLSIPIVQNPSITVEKSSATTSLSAPGTVTYDYLVTNTGNVTITGLVLSDNNDNDDMSCGSSTLTVAPDAGSTTTCTATHTFTQAELDAGGTLDNLVTASSNEAPDATDDLSIPIVQNPSITVEKSSATTSLSAPGTVTYDYLVTNTGNVTITGLVLSDNNDNDDMSCGSSTLTVAPDAGSTTTCTATHTFTQAELDAGGTLDNLVTASSNEAPDATDDLSIPIVQNPSITVEKSSATTSLSAPGTVTYDYLVTNTGNVTITGLVLSDNNDNDDMSCGSSTLTVAPDAGSTTTCTATHTFTQAELDAGGTLDNLVTASSNEAPDATDDLSIPIVQNPSITVEKSSATTSLSAPGTVTYDYLVTNTGNVTITGLVLSDNNDNDDMSCGSSTLTVAPDAGSTTTCTATHTFTQAELDAGGTLDNLVTASSNEAPDATDDLSIPIVQNPSITVEKSSATTSLSAPGTVTYDYLVTNTGNVTITGLVLSDNNDNDDMSCGSSTLTVAPDAGSTTTCTATHTFTQAELDAGGTLDNLVTASSNEAPDATDDLSIPIVQNPSITVEKSSATTSLSAPGTVTYDYLVTNTGNVTITGLVLSDNNDNDDMSCGSSTLTVAPDAGSTTTCTATHTFTQAELDAGGTLDNLVTASSNEAPDATDDLSIPIVQNPSITVEKSSATTSLSAPGTVTYDYLVTNTGNVTITGLVLSDNNDNDDMSCGSSTLTVAPDAGSTTTCTATHTFTQAELDAGGTLDNLVTASSNEAPDATDDLSIPIVQNPSITVEKSSATTSLSAPGTVTYDYLVTNTGNVTITGLVLSDNNDNDDMSCGSSTLTVAPDAGSTTTCTATHTFTQAELDAGGTLDNLVTASSNEAPDATDDLSIPIVQNPSITVEKSSATTSLSAPGTVTYDYLVTNTGNVTITGLVLSDNNDNDDMSCGSSTLTVAPDAGSTTTCTATHTFTQAELDAGGTLDNLVTASSNEAPDATDDLSIPIVQNPSITVEKSLASYDDNDLSGDITLGDELYYSFAVTNIGNVTLSNVTVTDNTFGLEVTCTDTTLAPEQSTTCATGTTPGTSHVVTLAEADAANVHNEATASGDDPGGDPTTDMDDLDTPVVQDPAIDIVKTFAVDSVIAGGAGSFFTLVVTNTGNVTLSGALIEDAVDPRLTVTSVSGTVGADADTDGNAQTVEWLISTLAPGASATITVNFAAFHDALGNADIGDPVVVNATVPNLATVAAEAPQGDPGNPGDDITDDFTDTIDILRDINLSIVKEFDPPEVEIPIQPQGTGQVFTIEVFNAGLSDADNVQVTDTVNGFLEIVAVTPGSPICTVTPTVISPGALPPLIASELDCTIDIPADDSVVITVAYIVAPFLDNETPIYGDPTSDGTEFRFVFENGSILEGNALGPVYLDGVEIDPHAGDPLTKNDYLFDPPGDGPFDQPFLMHLSCSDPYTGGWGQTDGPDEFDNPDWKIDYFSIARYKQGGQFFRNCGNVVDTFEVDNTATATGVDFFVDDCPDGECDVVSDDATVTIKEGILLDKFQKKAKHGSVDLTNFTGDPKLVEYVNVTWPDSNGNLRQINLDGVVIWLGDSPGEPGSDNTRTVTIGDYPAEDPEDPDDYPVDYDGTPWLADIIARTLDPNVTGKLTFHFTVKANDGDYEIRVTFDDGTFLDIVIADDAGSEDPPAGPCGDGFCALDEDCNSCAADCESKTNGPARNQFCCGNGIVEDAEGDGSVCDGNF